MADNPFGWIGDFVSDPVGTITDTISDEIMDFLGFGDDGNGNGNGAQTRTGNGTGTFPTTNGHAIPGCDVTVPVQVKQRAYAPPGYVVVQPPGMGKIGMKKEVARACGLWKASKKPPISARDWNCIKKAASTIGKLDRVVATANEVTGKADLKRVRPKRNGKG